MGEKGEVEVGQRGSLPGRAAQELARRTEVREVGSSEARAERRVGMATLQSPCSRRVTESWAVRMRNRKRCLH